MKRTIPVLILAILIINGCKPKSDTKNVFETKDVNTFKNNDNNNSNNSQSTGHWTPSYRMQMETDLRIYAKKHSLQSSQTNDFISCVISALEVKFPSENVDQQSAEAQNILQNCEQNYSNNQSSNNNNQYNTQAAWSSADQQEFMDNCTPGASKTLGSRAGSDYCNCMLKKLMQEYPNSKDVNNASEQHIKDLAADCKKAVYD